MTDINNKRAAITMDLKNLRRMTWGYWNGMPPFPVKLISLSFMSNLVSLRRSGIRKLRTLGRLWACMVFLMPFIECMGFEVRLIDFRSQFRPTKNTLTMCSWLGKFLSLSCLNCKIEKTVYQLDIVVALNGLTNVEFIENAYEWVFN